MKNLLLILLVAVSACKKPSDLEECQKQYKNIYVNVNTSYDSTSVTVQNNGESDIYFTSAFYIQNVSTIGYLPDDTLVVGQTKNIKFSEYISYDSDSSTLADHDSIRFWIYAPTGRCAMKYNEPFKYQPGYFLYKTQSIPLP
jgi:hypothetical protein